MTKIQFRFDQAHHVTIDGHAGFNPGNDIVCAAVSALAYTLIGALANLSNGITYTTESGHVEVTCPDSQEVRVIVMGIIIGYLQLEAKYPKHVKVRISGYKKIASSSSFLQKRMLT